MNDGAFTVGSLSVNVFVVERTSTDPQTGFLQFKKKCWHHHGVFLFIFLAQEYTLWIFRNIATCTAWKTLPQVPIPAVLMASFRPLFSMATSWSACKSRLMSSHSNWRPTFSKRWSSSLRTHCGEGVWDEESYRRYTEAQEGLVRAVKGEGPGADIWRIWKKLNITQARLALAFRVGKVAFSRYERGETRPPAPLVKLSYAIVAFQKMIKVVFKIIKWNHWNCVWINLGFIHLPFQTVIFLWCQFHLFTNNDQTGSSCFPLSGRSRLRRLWSRISSTMHASSVADKTSRRLWFPLKMYSSSPANEISL